MINRLKKQAIRKQFIKKRNALAQQAILDKSILIANNLINFYKYQQSEKIMLYVSTIKEVQTRNIFESAKKDQKDIFIPLIDKEKKDLMPSLIYDLNELTQTCLGIAQPKKEFLRIYSPQILDMVIVPGVAFTENGQRLGRGGGYYDRFLKKLSGNVCLVGLAFEIQIIDNMPIEANDVQVHYIITENRLIKAEIK